jgi:hypothetical protein
MCHERSYLVKKIWVQFVEGDGWHMFFAHCAILVECWAWYFKKSLAWEFKVTCKCIMCV